MLLSMKNGKEAKKRKDSVGKEERSKVLTLGLFFSEGGQGGM
jgi:hypothetical protein